MGASEGNNNAEKWTEEQAVEFLELAIETAKTKSFDFIGEVASELDTYREVFVYLRDKNEDCRTLYNRLVQVCETNCFSHAKKGEIVPSLGIINLKSNHGWTDRADYTSGGEKLDKKPDYSNLTNEELITLKELQNKAR